MVTIDDPQDAVPLARALLGGGVKIIELTLRTDSALTSLKLIAEEVPDILVGAGTILTPAQADAAVAAGARFLVSPGVTPALLTSMLSPDVPVLPGVATVGDFLGVLEAGLGAMKFFPAGPAGGPKYLAAIGAPVPQVQFCPTGGISLATAPRLPEAAQPGMRGRQLAHPGRRRRSQGLGPYHHPGQRSSGTRSTGQPFGSVTGQQGGPG